jgi:very-short-patch-repair endonuclease
VWPFIVDFLVSGKLVIEVQGKYWHSKSSRIRKDEVKKECLEAEGYTVLAITDEELYKHAEEVERTLRETCAKLFYPSSSINAPMW